MRMTLKSETIAALKHRRDALQSLPDRFADEERQLKHIDRLLARLRRRENRYFDAAGYDFLTRARIRKAQTEAERERALAVYR